ncbi:MAG: MBL fold metallo-hydrolase RNA specificity domain-containing protein [Desulfobaccales bacterium]
MRIHFHGAARTVTGSMHLLEVNGSKLLLDCGLFQGPRQETYARNRNFPFDPRAIDAVILSHAHIDHSGNLPHLVKHGYQGPIYATPATAHLTDLMLRDAGHIQEADARFINKKRTERGEDLIEPLYTEEDAARVKPFLRAAPYDVSFEPVPGVSACLVDAGHILGSAAVVLDLQESGRKVRLWYSGDIGRPDLPLLRDPVLPDTADVLLMECTYGDRLQPDPQWAYQQLREMVKATVHRGGKVIIPAFAVGRTQELVYFLHRMMRSGEVPRLPVYVDSPLAVNASEIFRLHPECFDAETLAFMRQSKHPALDFEQLTYIHSVEESKALNDRKTPMVIIAASGMAETGRILHHLRNNITDARNTILIVSWQAPHTLGRRLVEGERFVKIFGEIYERRAQVATINGFSAHAGQDQLVEYALRVKGTARQVILVHGEPEAAKILRKLLIQKGLEPVYYPDLHQSLEI